MDRLPTRRLLRTACGVGPSRVGSLRRGSGRGLRALRRSLLAVLLSDRAWSPLSRALGRTNSSLGSRRSRALSARTSGSIASYPRAVQAAMMWRNRCLGRRRRAVRRRAFALERRGTARMPKTSRGNFCPAQRARPRRRRLGAQHCARWPSNKLTGSSNAPRRGSGKALSAGKHGPRGHLRRRQRNAHDG